MEAWRKDLYLAHHGILGQKWGKKNGPPYPLDPEDRSAAERKKAKKNYKSDEKRMSKDYSKNESLVRKIAKSNMGYHTLAKLTVKSNEALSKKHFVKDDDGKGFKMLSNRTRKKAARIADAQRKSNTDYEEYVKHTSTGRLIAQDLLFGKVGSAGYRRARARGAGRFRAVWESSGLLAYPLRALGTKKAYGEYLLLSGMNSGDEL